MQVGIHWAMDHKNRYLDMANVSLNDKPVIINAETGRNEMVDVPMKAYVASYGKFAEDNNIIGVRLTEDAAKELCQSSHKVPLIWTVDDTGIIYAANAAYSIQVFSCEN